MSGVSLEAPAVPGRTVVRARAVHRVVRAAAARAAGVDADDVVVTLSDRHGALGVDLVLPVLVGPHVTGSLAERATTLCAQVAEQTADLTGREVGEVDVRFASVRRPPERRVR